MSVNHNVLFMKPRTHSEYFKDTPYDMLIAPKLFKTLNTHEKYLKITEFLKLSVTKQIFVLREYL